MRRGGSSSPRGGGGTYDVSPFSLAAAQRVSGFHNIASAARRNRHENIRQLVLVTASYD